MYLKSGGGEKGRESGNNGERFRTKGGVLQNELHACKTMK